MLKIIKNYMDVVKNVKRREDPMMLVLKVALANLYGLISIPIVMLVVIIAIVALIMCCISIKIPSFMAIAWAMYSAAKEIAIIRDIPITLIYDHDTHSLKELYILLRDSLEDVKPKG